MATLIDSNVIVSLLIESDKTADARVVLGSIDDPVTIMSVVEECMYVGLSLVYGVRGHSLKAEIERGLGDVAKQFVGGWVCFLRNLGLR